MATSLMLWMWKQLQFLSGRHLPKDDVAIVVPGRQDAAIGLNASDSTLPRLCVSQPTSSASSGRWKVGDKVAAGVGSVASSRVGVVVMALSSPVTSPVHAVAKSRIKQTRVIRIGRCIVSSLDFSRDIGLEGIGPAPALSHASRMLRRH